MKPTPPQQEEPSGFRAKERDLASGPGSHAMAAYPCGSSFTGTQGCSVPQPLIRDALILRLSRDRDRADREARGATVWPIREEVCRFFSRGAHRDPHSAVPAGDVTLES